MGQLLTEGPTPDQADAVLIMLHGRGASARDILSLYDALQRPSLAACAPEAPNHTWYPYSFLAPVEDNQPDLDHALNRIDQLVNKLLAASIPSERIALLGFSQGACLTVEYAIRHPRRYGAIMALTGGFIGPPGTVRDESGDFAGTPVFLGANDPDPHVPFDRVQETAAVMIDMRAEVNVSRYPGEPHAVNADELRQCGALLDTIIQTHRTP